MNPVAERFVDRPIIGPELHPYYLYFADHKGSYIRLAYADALTGRWDIHPPGSLTLAQSGFPIEPLVVSGAAEAAGWECSVGNDGRLIDSEGDRDQ